MATIEAARALCMEDTIGSLREGKLADLIILDLSGPQMNPIYERPIRNLVPNLVYSALGNEVESVMIDGTFVIENGRLTTGDEGEIISAVNRAAARISEEMEALPWTAGQMCIRDRPGAVQSILPLYAGHGLQGGGVCGKTALRAGTWRYQVNRKLRV